MSIPMDLAVYDSGRQLAAVVEVKVKRQTSRKWAAEFRRNLLEHGGKYRPTFFLIVTPDRIYLWKNAGTTPMIVDPDYEVDARPVFQPYFDAAHLNPDGISSFAFEMIVSSWLNNVALVRDPAAELPDHERLFIEAGFVHAIQGGKIEQEVAA